MIAITQSINSESKRTYTVEEIAKLRGKTVEEILG